MMRVSTVLVILASMPRALVKAERAGRRSPDSKVLTYLASALHCRGVQKTKKSPGSGQSEVRMGKNTYMGDPLETLIHRNFFFSGS